MTADTDRARAWGDELRAVHRRLRDALDVARESLEAGGPPSGDLLLFCHGFCAALTGHHRSEDAGLFPELLAARPELGPVVAELQGDHRQLDHLIGALEHALADGVPADVAREHLDGIDAVMQTHFLHEEKKLLSLLDAGIITGEHHPRALLGPLA